MIDIFACPKPMKGPMAVIQRRALNSWRTFIPESTITLLGDDSGVNKLADEFRVNYIPDIKKDSDGVPLVSSIFEIIYSVSKKPISAYVNADIILVPQEKAIWEKFIDMGKFLLVGQRYDVDLDILLDDANIEQWDQILSIVTVKGILHGMTGLDYFFFPRNLFSRPFPEFSLGRCAWDNWILYEAHLMGATLVDFTNGMMAIHQNHDYRHAKVQSAEELWKSDQANYNRTLSGNNHYDLWDVDQMWKAGKICPTISIPYFERRMERCSQEHPCLWRFLRYWALRRMYVSGYQMIKNIKFALRAI